MARASVSRRLVFIKKTKNPVAPLPQRSAPKNETVMERPAPRHAPVVRAKPAERGRVAKLAAIFVGLLCLGAAIGVMGRAQMSASSDYAEPEIRPASSAALRAPLSASDDYREVGLPSVLSQRSAPTDDSFRASAYVRRR
jgi:hypothetical protein